MPLDPKPQPAGRIRYRDRQADPAPVVAPRHLTRLYIFLRYDQGRGTSALVFNSCIAVRMG